MNSIANITENTIKIIGFKAYEALTAAGGDAQSIPGFAHTPYLHVSGEIIWLGSDLAELHPRAVILEKPFVIKGKLQHFDTSAIRPWYPQRSMVKVADLPRLVAACRRLFEPLHSLGPVRGFGAMLLDQEPEYPLKLAIRNIENIACGFRKDSPEHVYQAALPLIGFGSGMTPSGDDFIGAALFGRALLEKRNALDVDTWDEVGRRLIAKARDRSHIISATLMADLVHAQSFAPLHQLSEALVHGESQAEALAAIRELVSIGHSSGWDMLSGFIVGITGQVSLRDSHSI